VQSHFPAPVFPPLFASQDADQGRILHSLSGTMAISETALKTPADDDRPDQRQGGVLGRPLEAVVVDPASNWPLFAEKARQLITQDQVQSCSVADVGVAQERAAGFKELNHLLFYPCSTKRRTRKERLLHRRCAQPAGNFPRPNTDEKEGGAAKRFFLLGTDYVYPRTTNKILRAFLKSKGVSEKDIEEIYTPFGHSDYQTIVANVKKFAGGGKTCVISTINGDSNVPFYKELGNAAWKAKDVPVVAFSVGEEKLRGVDTKPLVVTSRRGTTSCRSRIRPTKRSSSRTRTTPRRRTCRTREGRHQRSDGSHLIGMNLWKQAVEKAKTTDIER